MSISVYAWGSKGLSKFSYYPGRFTIKPVKDTSKSSKNIPPHYRVTDEATRLNMALIKTRVFFGCNLGFSNINNSKKYNKWKAPDAVVIKSFVDLKSEWDQVICAVYKQLFNNNLTLTHYRDAYEIYWGFLKYLKWVLENNMSIIGAEKEVEDETVVDLEALYTLKPFQHNFIKELEPTQKTKKSVSSPPRKDYNSPVSDDDSLLWNQVMVPILVVGFGLSVLTGSKLLYQYLRNRRKVYKRYKHDPYIQQKLYQLESAMMRRRSPSLFKDLHRVMRHELEYRE